MRISKLPVRRIIISKLSVRSIITGKFPVRRQIGKSLVSRVITGKFSLGLMKLRTLDLNLVIIYISNFLAKFAPFFSAVWEEDVSSDLVLAEKVFVFF